MKKVLWLLVAGIFLSYQSVGQAASTVDSLVQKLVEKGILSSEEATQLKSEIAYEESNTVEAGAKKQVPEWVQNFKIGGDFRGRIQTEKRKNSTFVDQGERVRARMRARLNFETKVNDKARVVVGIATDGGNQNNNFNNPRSGNYTYSSYSGTGAANPFSKPYVVLNKAYGQYMVNDRLTLTLGKMDNPIWEPMEFLWDSDITPEGGAVQYNYKLNDKVSFFTTGTAFALNEFNPSTSDPFMYVGQFGAIVKPSDKMDVKAAFTYTGYGNIKSGFTGPASGSSSGTNNTLNTANGTNGLKYDYSAPMGSIEIGFNDPIPDSVGFPLYIPRVGLFGELTSNPGAENKNVAWMAGAYLGNSKVSSFGAWKTTFAYKTIARDSWLDIFPDSDFYSGQTGTKGAEAILEFGLAKNMTFVLDYYHARRIGSTVAKAPEHLVQYDINWKF